MSKVVAGRYCSQTLSKVARMQSPVKYASLNAECTPQLDNLVEPQHTCVHAFVQTTCCTGQRQRSHAMHTQATLPLNHTTFTDKHQPEPPVLCNGLQALCGRGCSCIGGCNISNDLLHNRLQRHRTRRVSLLRATLAIGSSRATVRNSSSSSNSKH